MHYHFHGHGKGAWIGDLIDLTINYGPYVAMWLAIPPPWEVSLCLLIGLGGVVSWRGRQHEPFLELDEDLKPLGVEFLSVCLAFLLAVWPLYAYTHLLFWTFFDDGLGHFAAIIAVALLGYGCYTWYQRACVRWYRIRDQAQQAYLNRPKPWTARLVDGEQP